MNAKTEVAKWAPAMEGSLAKVREKTRELVATQLRAIDELVSKLVEVPVTSPAQTQKRTAQAAMFEPQL